MAFLYKVEIVPGIEYYCVDADNRSFSLSDHVIFELEQYIDCGEIIEVSEEDATNIDTSNRKRTGNKNNPFRILRGMTINDKSKAHENETRARSMFRTADRKIDEHHLAMKMVNCHYSFDKKVAVFQFASEDRVDFRDFIKDLSGALHVRVELKQIGVRDEAAIKGGLGPCGRSLCCATILDQFKSVNVKMAKAQGLSLNPNNVSGVCGRLKCCLRYEVDCYREMSKNLPTKGTRCRTPDGDGEVLECEPLTQKIRVKLDEGELRLAEFNAKELGYSCEKDHVNHSSNADA